MTQEYIKWRGSSRATVTEFADYLGISQSLLSQYMRKDGKKPNPKNLIQIAQKLGPAVYDVLSLPHPEDPFSHLPLEFSQRLQAALAEMRAELARLGLSPSDPAAIPVIARVFAQHGFEDKTIR